MAISGVRSLTLSNVASQLPGNVQPEDPLDPGEMVILLPQLYLEPLNLRSAATFFFLQARP
jgi:hypothetical protein